MNPRTMETATRLGFAARAVMYLLLGWFALRTGHGEDGKAVLDYLNDGAGKVLLGIMAVGFLGYGLWRIGESMFDSEGHGSGPKASAVRAGGAVSGLIHLGLSIYAFGLATSTHSAGGQSGGESTRQGAAAALSLPGGPLLLGIAAAALAITGAYQLVKAAKAGFLKHLQPDAAARPWVKWTGQAGYAARGIVFLIMAWTLFHAARDENAGRAGDMGTAIDLLSGPLQSLVAAGLLLFGAYSGVEAIYRRINDPDVIRRLKAKLA